MNKKYKKYMFSLGAFLPLVATLTTISCQSKNNNIKEYKVLEVDLDKAIEAAEKSSIKNKKINSKTVINKKEISKFNINDKDYKDPIIVLILNVWEQLKKEISKFDQSINNVNYDFLQLTKKIFTTKIKDNCKRNLNDIFSLPDSQFDAAFRQFQSLLPKGIKILLLIDKLKTNKEITEEENKLFISNFLSLTNIQNFILDNNIRIKLISKFNSKDKVVNIDLSNGSLVNNLYKIDKNLAITNIFMDDIKDAGPVVKVLISLVGAIFRGDGGLEHKDRPLNLTQTFKKHVHERMHISNDVIDVIESIINKIYKIYEIK